MLPLTLRLAAFTIVLVYSSIMPTVDDYDLKSLKYRPDFSRLGYTTLSSVSGVRDWEG